MRVFLTSILLSLFCILAGGLNTSSVQADTSASVDYPAAASAEEREALDNLAAQIEGALIYTHNARVKKVTIGDWRVEDLGDGDFVRWGPLGDKIAVLHGGAVYVMNADGSDRRQVVEGGVTGGDGCQIEFHTNGHEIIYGFQKQLWTVDIVTGEKRSMNLPFNTEINISGDGKHMVMRTKDCFLVELPGTEFRLFAGGCSPCVSPDGTLMASNDGGHRTMGVQKWNGELLFKINTSKMAPDLRWDNMHWSNHNDYITMQGDGKFHDSYAFHIHQNAGTRLTWEGKTKYPDLFVSKDLKTGQDPRTMTLAWASANGVAIGCGDSSGQANSTPARNYSEHAAKIRDFTGGPTRAVWAQATGASSDLCATKTGFLLVGYCTEDGKEERVILSDVTSYAKPIFTPDGQQVVYSDRTNNKIYLVNWDGSGNKEIGSGFASDLWRDPATDIVWLYYRGGNGAEKGGVMRQRLDNPGVREKVWDQTPTGHPIVPWFRLSADGTTAATAFPYSSCGVADLTTGTWEKYGNGCWASLAPDNSYRYFNFHGSHKEIGLFDAGKKNFRKVDVSGGPGVDGRNKVYHPRWSNNVRFLNVSGPKQSEKSEILLGRFSDDFSKVEDWIQISNNDKPDYYGDVWIQSGWQTKLSLKPARKAEQAVPSETTAGQDFSRFTRWPGDQADLMFLWENNNSTNQTAAVNDKPGRLCRAAARDHAVFGRFYEMDLAGGAVLAQDADADLLAACKASNALTLEATITPVGVVPATASIISFSRGDGDSNFTLSQNQGKLVLKLRTPATAKQGDQALVELGEVRPGRPYHVVVSYQPGQLICIVNGKPVLKTDRLTGDFSNWEPAHLLFGDEWDGGHDWNGRLDGVAIYSRAVTEAEAVHKHRLYAQRLGDRKPIEQIVVRAKLNEITPTPSVEDLQEYSRALVVHSYEIVEVLKGPLDAETIQVAHWALLDRKKLPQADQRKLGEVYELLLESYAMHPQLESERSFNDCSDFDAPVYYDVASRSPLKTSSTVAGR